MSLTYETLRYEQEGRIARLTLDRPGRRNAVTPLMLAEVHDVLARAARDESLSVLVLTGANGDFCAGADLKGPLGQEDRPAEPPHIEDAWFGGGLLLHQMRAVTIAAVDGACAGAGFSWACACDLRIASAGARFNTAFLDVGASGDMAGIWFVSRLLGAAKTRELFLTPSKFDAAQALNLGLVSNVHESEAFPAAIDALAARLAAAPPLTLAAMKANLLDAETLDLPEYLAAETQRHRAVMASADTREAFLARAQKRPPRFTGH